MIWHPGVCARELVQALPGNDMHYCRATLVETFLMTSLREIELRLGEEAAFANFRWGMPMADTGRSKN